MTEPAQDAPIAKLLHPEEKKETPKKNGKALWIFTGIILLVGIVWFCLWFFYFRFHEFTDDAYANGSMININAAVPGNVIAFYADNTDLVQEGQLLVALDPTKYRIEYEKELQELAATVLEVRKLYDNVQVNAMKVKVQKTTLSKIQYDHDNRAQLIDSQAISNQDFIHSRDDLSIAESQLRQAEEELKVAKDLAGNTVLIHHPKIEQQKGNVRRAFYQLKHCNIYSPATGYVAQRNVNVGEWAATTTNLMAVIPVDYVWVDANYKETQLTYMRVGQPAVVLLDMYGSDVKYEGKVLGIASGSGSVFSLIPPQNATGNWIKIVQRLPVRISLDPETVKKYPIRLGVSAEVHVDITNQDLPFLPQIPAKGAVSTTNVYHLNLEEVEHTMARMIQEHL